MLNLNKNSSIVIIDDDCIFCNFWGNYIISHDLSSEIKVTSSSSQIGKELLKKTTANPKETIIYFFNNEFYTHSNAVIKIALKMRGWHTLFKMGYLIPKKIRNYFYMIVSNRRKGIMTNRCHIDNLRNRDKYIS